MIEGLDEVEKAGSGLFPIVFHSGEGFQKTSKLLFIAVFLMDNGLLVGWVGCCVLVEELMYTVFLDFRCSAQERDGAIDCRLGRFNRLGHWSNGGIFPLLFDFSFF